MYIVRFRESSFHKMLLQIRDLLGNALTLIMENEGDQIVRRMPLVGTKIAGLVYEHTKIRHMLPR